MVCRSEAVTDACVAYLQGALADRRVVDLDLAPDEPQPWDRLKAGVPEVPRPVVVIRVGRAAGDGPPGADFWSRLNLGRELVQRLGWSAVLRVPGMDALGGVRDAAPDLWAHRVDVHHLLTEEEFGGIQWPAPEEDRSAVGQLRQFVEEAKAGRRSLWPLTVAAVGAWTATYGESQLHYFFGLAEMLDVFRGPLDGIFASFAINAAEALGGPAAVEALLRTAPTDDHGVPAITGGQREHVIDSMLLSLASRGPISLWGRPVDGLDEVRGTESAAAVHSVEGSSVGSRLVGAALKRGRLRSADRALVEAQSRLAPAIDGGDEPPTGAGHLRRFMRADQGGLALHRADTVAALRHISDVVRRAAEERAVPDLLWAYTESADTYRRLGLYRTGASFPVWWSEAGPLLRQRAQRERDLRTGCGTLAEHDLVRPDQPPRFQARLRLALADHHAARNEPAPAHALLDRLLAPTPPVRLVPTAKEQAALDPDSPDLLEAAYAWVWRLGPYATDHAAYTAALAAANLPWIDLTFDPIADLRAVAWELRAVLCRRAGAWSDALDALDAAIAWYRDHGWPDPLANALAERARVLTAAGDPSSALSAVAAGREALAGEFWRGEDWRSVYTLNQLALQESTALLAAARPDGALSPLEDALAMVREEGLRAAEPALLCAIATLPPSAASLARRELALREVRALATETGLLDFEVRAFLAEAELRHHEGDAAASARALDRARETLLDLPDWELPHVLAQVEQRLRRP